MNDTLGSVQIESSTRFISLCSEKWKHLIICLQNISKAERFNLHSKRLIKKASASNDRLRLVKSGGGV